MTAPLPGPLGFAPDIARDVALTMLDVALDDLPMGPWDTEVRGWVELADPAYVATVASWCRRSWQAGVEAGRAECTDEVTSYHEGMQRLCAELDQLQEGDVRGRGRAGGVGRGEG